MKIIISPAKKMNNREDELDFTGLPCFISEAEQLKCYIQGLDFEAARELWGCNEDIARLNFKRFKDMDLRRRLTPALLSYEGIQYQHMAPGVFERRQWDYVQKHLRILSGFYGVLRPLDGIVPYRLEMQAKIHMDGAAGAIRSLYAFWGRKLYEELWREEQEQGEQCPVIVNLASREYSKAIEPYLEENVRFVTCVFGVREKAAGAGFKVKATEAKMARGQMVRFMAERSVTDMETLKEFEFLGYHYSGDASERNQLMFIKEIKY